jgi:protein TonB
MRKDLIIGIAVSVLLHVGFLYGEKLWPKGKAVVVEKQEEEQIIRMELPPLPPEELDEVEELEDEPAPSELAPPTLIDMPTVVPLNAMTQPIQPPPPPGLEVAKGAVSIPVTRPGANFGKGMKDLFDISNLDQVPQPRVQVQPQYPFEMRRAGISGEVLVAFIVGTTGDVVDAYAVKSTQREFEAPAVQAVLKWKFRPGRKSGRAVNTRMQVPIVFNLSDE